jgi:hypothetical protein
MNNVLIIKSATNLLIHHFPSFYFQGCVVHCLDLLLEDWGKTGWVKQIVKKAKVIVSFIRQHHAPLAIFCHYQATLMLLNLIETWFATKFLMVERLFKFRLAIEQIIVNLDWITFVNSLCGNHCQKSLTKARVVRANKRSDEFWDTCANFVYMVESILMSLKAFDGKQPCMGKVWLIMKTLK